MKRISNIFALTVLSAFIYADEEATEQSFPGLVSSEIFNMGNGMDMHVERRKTCSQGTVAKHFHPAAGTLVYVLAGTSQSKSNGKWKPFVPQPPSTNSFPSTLIALALPLPALHLMPDN